VSIGVPHFATKPDANGEDADNLCGNDGHEANGLRREKNKTGALLDKNGATGRPRLGPWRSAYMVEIIPFFRPIVAVTPVLNF
jgi:hypothetical protein